MEIHRNSIIEIPTDMSINEIFLLSCMHRKKKKNRNNSNRIRGHPIKIFHLIKTFPDFYHQRHTVQFTKNALISILRTPCMYFNFEIRYSTR